MDDKKTSHIFRDLKLAMERKGLGGLARDLLLHPGNQAIAMYRLYRWLYVRGHIFLAFLGYRLNYFLCGVEIHPDADIGPDFHLDHPIAVLVGRRTRIGKGVRLYSHAAIGAIGMPDEHPFLDVRDGVQIYHGAHVAGSCTIGEYAQIGLNSMVLDQDIPPYAVVVGTPGKVIRIGDKKVNPDDYKDYKYDPADYHGPPPSDERVEKLKKLSWTDPSSYGG
jgi:serine O-acetyltransferase